MQNTQNVPNREEILAELRRLLSAVLDNDLSATPEDLPLLDLITSSLAMVDGMRRLYDRFGVMISLRQIIEAQTTMGILSYEIEAELKKRAEQTKSGTRPDKPKKSNFEAIPLAASQQHIAFLSRYSPLAAASYNEAQRLGWVGKLDEARMREALSAITTRYEGTRIALSPDKDELHLYSGPRLPMRLTEVSQQMLLPLVAELVNQPFAVGEPLFRMELLRLGASHFEILLVGHSLSLDQAGLGQIAVELLAEYSGYEVSWSSSGNFSWRDYQIQFQSTETLKRLREAKRYWQDELTPMPPRLELPTDKQRPAVKQYEGARVAQPLTTALVEKLVAFAEGRGYQPETVIEATFSLWLHRLSQQDRLLIGFNSGPRQLTAGDDSHLIEDSVGLNSRYDGQKHFAEWVSQHSEKLAASRQHNLMAAADLIQLLNRSRDQSRSTPFSAGMRHWTQPDLPSVAQVSVEFMPVPMGVARYDLELILISAGSVPFLYCDYSSELFLEETVVGWLDGFIALLAAGLGDPEQQCCRLPMMSAEVHDKIVQQWNQTDAELPSETTLLDLIEVQCKQRDHDVALFFADRQLSYGELWQRSGQLAASLADGGVVANDRVAILMPRSLDLLPAMLAVWRLGAAYVPLDPTFPAERLRYMLENAQVAATLTTDSLAEKVSVGAVVLLDQPLPTSQVFEFPVVTPEQTAYIIYTSGSTGHPKGVEISHKSLVNFILGTNAMLQMEPGQRMLALTTISFDISLTELFIPLMVGASVDICSDLLAADGLSLIAHLQASQPSHMQATPSTWKSLLGAGWSGNPHLMMLAAGEKLERGLAESLLVEERTLWNLYGPTEATVYATGCRVDSSSAQPISIGKPLANCRIYILDTALQPVPVGAIGELYIGGLGVAKGYWQRADLNKESFVADPFNKGGCLYRTGDLARYLPDGNVMCLGRKDHQVKIHGVRIEPGEIEAALQAVAGIADAVVTSWQDSQGDLQLVGHVIRSAASLEATQIRQQLRRSLPEVMIPPHILFAESFPQTANGKIDRRALPEPIGGPADPNHDRVAPQTPTERLLAEAWAELLAIDVHSIGRDAHFFDLGGHSLSMTPLMLEVRQRFHINLRLYEFFDALTLKAFAALIDERRRNRNGNSAQPGATTDRRTDAYAKQRMAYLRQEGELPATIVPARGQFYRANGQYERVLMTGATGFLGVYMVAEILQTTEANLYCLVRPKKGSDGKERIEQQMRFYDVWPDTPEWQEKWHNRVEVLEGDVTLPLLGLHDRHYERLTHEIDAILHSAAHVNFIYPYEALRATNVLGLHEIVRFAFAGRIKPVHHLSTAAIWPMGSQLTFYEKDSIEHNQLLNLGYDEAKWVGEQVLINAAERGLPVARYRPGEVGGDSVTGRCVTDHFVFASIKGYLQFGAFPTLDIEVDIAPVDYVAKSLVFLMFKRNALGRAFHLTNPNRRHMSDALTFLRSLGYRFDEMRFEELRNQLVNKEGFVHNALFAYQSVLEEMDDVSLQLPTYDTRQTDRLLKGSDVHCAPADEKLFGTYINYLRKIGYLPEPEVQAAANLARMH